MKPEQIYEEGVGVCVKQPNFILTSSQGFVREIRQRNMGNISPVEKDNLCCHKDTPAIKSGDSYFVFGV